MKKEDVARLVQDFGDRSEAADREIRSYVESRSSEGQNGQEFDNSEEAMRWLEDEKENLVELISSAMEYGLYRGALRLAEGLWPLFLRRRYARLWLRAAAMAIPAARELDDQEALGRLLNKRALVYSHLGQTEEALRDLEAAEEIWTHRKDQKRAAQTLQRRGTVYYEAGRHEEAIGSLQDALAADEHTDAEHHKAVTLFMLGRAHLDSGSPEKALGFLEQSLPLLDGSGHNQALARITLGGALVSLGSV